MTLKTAIILVGGKAMRLRPLTEDIPKCMITVADKPLLYWILKWLKNNHIKKVILGVAHKKEIIEKYIEENNFDMDIALNDHTEAQGTGDAFRLAIENQNVIDDVFLAMNGDELTDVSLTNLVTFHKHHNPVATLLVSPLRSQFGLVTTDSSHGVTKFEEKPMLDTYFVNAGVYLFTQEIRNYLPQRGDIERTTFKQLAEENKIKAFKYFGFWNTINNVKELKEMEKNVQILKESRGE